jgi:hypothetical protein
MAEIINLNKARKAKRARVEKPIRAQENRGRASARTKVNRSAREGRG